MNHTAPAELSISELALLLGIPRRRLIYRIRTGGLRTFRTGGNPRGKHMVALEDVRLAYPELYDSLVQRASRLSEVPDDDD